MTMTTQRTTFETIQAFIADLGTGLRLLAEHARDISRGVSSTRKAMQMRDLSKAELRELGVTHDRVVEYSFRDEI